MIMIVMQITWFMLYVPEKTFYKYFDMKKKFDDLKNYEEKKQKNLLQLMKNRKEYVNQENYLDQNHMKVKEKRITQEMNEDETYEGILYGKIVS